MALPKIPTLEYTLKLPISGKEINYRPYSVAEEKILLSIATSKQNDPKFYAQNLKKVLNQCITVPDGTPVGSLAAVEVDYAMLFLRARSVGETVDARYTNADKKVVDITLNIDDFEIEIPEDHVYKIALTDEIGLIMQDITFDQRIDYASRFTGDNQTDAIYESIIDSIKSLYDADKVYVVGTDTTRAEVIAFINGLQGKSAPLYRFVTSMPKLSVEVTDVNTRERFRVTSDEIDFLS